MSHCTKKRRNGMEEERRQKMGLFLGPFRQYTLIFRSVQGFGSWEDGIFSFFSLGPSLWLLAGDMDE